MKVDLSKLILYSICFFALVALAVLANAGLSAYEHTKLKELYKNRAESHSVAVQHLVNERMQQLVMSLEYLAAHLEFDEEGGELSDGTGDRIKTLLFEKPDVSFIGVGTEDHLFSVRLGAVQKGFQSLQKGSLDDPITDKNITSISSVFYACPESLNADKYCTLILVPVFRFDSFEQFYLSAVLDTTDVIKSVLKDYRAAHSHELELNFKKDKMQGVEVIKSSVRLLENGRIYYLSPRGSLFEFVSLIFTYANYVLVSVFAGLILFLFVWSRRPNLVALMEEVEFKLLLCDGIAASLKEQLSCVADHCDRIVWVYNVSERCFEFISDNYEENFHQSKELVMEDPTVWYEPIDEFHRESVKESFSAFRFSDTELQDRDCEFTVNVEGGAPLRYREYSHCLTTATAQPQRIIGVINKL